MNQQPDKLFRDKLQNYQKTAPTTAWERISSAQGTKKNNKLIWLRIAASLLILAASVASWLVIRPNRPAPASMAQNSPAAAPAPEVTPSPAVSEALNAAERTPDKTGNAKVAKVPQRPATKEPGPAQPNGVAQTREQIAHHTPSKETSSAMDTSKNPAPADEPAVAVLPATDVHGSDSGGSAHSETVASINTSVDTSSQNVTLNYSTQDVAAYLDKNFDDEATDDDKKQSTLQKLLQKANDLKTNQDAFGELRQRKNEILALNFKNDKRGQKTRN